jgi:hypothetical protein
MEGHLPSLDGGVEAESQYLWAAGPTDRLHIVGESEGDIRIVADHQDRAGRQHRGKLRLSFLLSFRERQDDGVSDLAVQYETGGKRHLGHCGTYPGEVNRLNSCPDVIRHPDQVPS